MARDLKEALRTLQGFTSLGDASLEDIARHTTIRSMRAGETIFCQGEPSPYFFGVISGEVAIQRVSSDKRFPEKVLGIVGPGGLFGESSIFEDSPRLAMGSASKDGELVVIRGSEFRQWLKKEPAQSQSLLLTLLQTTVGRLHRTNHELSVVYGVGRLFGSTKPFEEQLSAAMDFLKGSLEGLDDLVFYRRSAYWEEMEAVKSLPVLTELPAVPVANELIQKVSDSGGMLSFDPAEHRTSLDAFKLNWSSRASAAIIPLFSWEKSEKSLQAVLLLASAKRAEAFSAEKQLLLSALALPIAEALARHGRQQDSQAQTRLEQARQSYRQ